MHHRTLGKTNIPVSEIGFGAWAIGSAWGDLVPEQQAKAALHAALDSGVDLIDTADVYGDGRSESLIGDVLKERPDADNITVITKMGRAADWTDSYDVMRAAAETAIERLGVPCLDLVQLHCIPTETLKAGRAFDNMERLKSAGIIKHYGASVETIEEALICIEHGGPATLQVIYNIFRQRITDHLLPAAAGANVGIIARVPLASGVLTGKFTDKTTFPESDHRNFNADGQAFNVGETFGGVPFQDAVAFASKITEALAPDCPNATLAQKAIRWILDHPQVSTVIPGARSPRQAIDNTVPTYLPALTSESHALLAELYGTKIAPKVRGVY